MGETLSVLGDLLGGIVELVEFLGKGLQNLIDFILNLPNIYHRFIDFTPMPIQSILLSFIGIIITIIVMKVVSHFV